MPKYFDIHSHLNFKDFDGDLEEVIQRLRDTDTHTIVVGTDYESSKSAMEIAEKYEGIYACIGIHPIDSKDSDISLFSELVKSSKVVAIGECGLDFYHADKATDFERQKNLFLKQVEFALLHDRPLMIHARDAYPELLEILEPMKVEHGEKLRGNIHFFAGNLEQAKRFWNINFSTSFTGVITFVRDYDEVIKNAPIEMIMSETDAPFVAPTPYRGKRNEPSYVNEVAQKIAEIRREDLKTTQKALVSNAKRLFGL